MCKCLPPQSAKKSKSENDKLLRSLEIATRLLEMLARPKGHPKPKRVNCKVHYSTFTGKVFLESVGEGN